MINMRKLTETFGRYATVPWFLILSSVLVLSSYAISWTSINPVWLLLVLFPFQALILLIFAMNEIGVRRKFFLVLVGLIAVVLSFGFVYQDIGVHQLESREARTLSYSDALYFSVVTFTTLGYGDFSPKPEYRMLSALQALLGYVFLGLMVGIALNLGNKRTDVDEKDS